MRKFESMVERFGAHETATFNAVESPRKRLLLKSAAAALEDDAIVRAVGVVYEDIAPARIAGDLIFRKLESSVAVKRGVPTAKALARPPPPLDEAAVADALRSQLAEWPEEIVAETVDDVLAGLRQKRAQLAGARRVFDAVDGGSEQLDVAALERLGTAVRSVGQCAECTCGKTGSCDSVTSLMEEVESEEHLTFSTFMLGYLERFPHTELLTERHDELVDELLKMPGAPVYAAAADEPDAPPASAQFQSMVDEVRGWAADPTVLERATAKNARLSTVLAGCFAGAQNDEVLKAFAIVYDDYRAFRLAGNLIFKLMKKLVGNPVAAAAKAPEPARPAGQRRELVRRGAALGEDEIRRNVDRYADLSDLFAPRRSKRGAVARALYKLRPAKLRPAKLRPAGA